MQAYFSSKFSESIKDVESAFVAHLASELGHGKDKVQKAFDSFFQSQGSSKTEEKPKVTVTINKNGKTEEKPKVTVTINKNGKTFAFQPSKKSQVPPKEEKPAEKGKEKPSKEEDEDKNEEKHKCSHTTRGRGQGAGICTNDATVKVGDKWYCGTAKNGHAHQAMVRLKKQEATGKKAPPKKDEPKKEEAKKKEEATEKGKKAPAKGKGAAPSKEPPAKKVLAKNAPKKEIKLKQLDENKSIDPATGILFDKGKVAFGKQAKDGKTVLPLDKEAIAWCESQNIPMDLTRVKKSKDAKKEVVNVKKAIKPTDLDKEMEEEDSDEESEGSDEDTVGDVEEESDDEESEDTEVASDEESEEETSKS